jgi:hypothetical protein
MQAANGAVTARLPETYQWLLVPEQATPQAPIEWQAIRISGSDALAVRASKKLRGDDLLITSLGATILRKHLDEVPLWRGDHVPIRQLVDDFARYLYLPRLSASDVLTQAIRDGIGLLTWSSDSFAYAESYDESGKRYRGLRGAQTVTITADSAGLVVKPDVARRQMTAEAAKESGSPTGAPTAAGEGQRSTPPAPPGPQDAPTEPKPRRYYGTVRLDPARVGRDASRIADEVISHLAGQDGAEVTVTLEINAKLPNEANDQLVRIVTENSRTLKFDNHGFERE